MRLGPHVCQVRSNAQGAGAPLKIPFGSNGGSHIKKGDEYMKKISWHMGCLMIALMFLSGCGSGGAVSGSNEGAAQNGGAVQSSSPIFINVGTAAAGGSFYPAGTAIANVLNNHLKESLNLQANAQATGGSTENINMMRNKEMEAAILTAAVAYQAYNGVDEFDGNPYPELRTICQIWANPIQMVVTKNSNINTWQGLKDKRISVGQAASGTEVLTNEMLTAIPGIEISDIKAEYLGFSQSADAIRDGRIDGAQMSGGVPVQSVMDLFVSPNVDVKLLPMSQADRDAVTAMYSYWDDYTIAAGSYPNQTEDCDTVALFVQLGIRSDLDEELVYQMTKALFDNISEIYQAYDAMSGMTSENAFTGLVAPLHAGAVRYFEEKGLDIPEQLIPPEY
jgi:TRAP transporter TAXI family solute receptor